AKASTQLQKFPALLTNLRKFRLSLMKARIADANLRDQEANAALSSMADAVIALGKDLRDRDYEALSDIIDLHARGLFCPSCGKPVAEPIQRILRLRLNQLAAPGGSIRLESFLDVVGLVPPETFPAADLQRISRRALQEMDSGTLINAQEAAALKNELRLADA